MKNLLLVLSLGVAAFAQMMRPAPPTPTELKAALGLTDQQISQLQQLQRDRFEAERQVMQQIREKEKSLHDLVSGGSTDALAIGRLVLDIQALRQQTAAIAKRFQDQALALLTAEQKTKLKALDDAMKLRPAIDQAIGLNLLTAPAPPGPPGPGMGPRGMGMMMRRGGPRF